METSRNNATKNAVKMAYWRGYNAAKQVYQKNFGLTVMAEVEAKNELEARENLRTYIEGIPENHSVRLVIKA